MTAQHPAYNLPFSDLIDGLENEVDLGNITRRNNSPLTQYTYSKSCVYEGNWNLFTIIARGLIVDHERIIAYPFPKFWNLSENKTEIPDLPFECIEKCDGSLIISYHYFGSWQTATKGSFHSDQAIWAKSFIDKNHYEKWMNPGWTYLYEAIYPSNRIVVNYGPEEKLVLLGVYTDIGYELSLDALKVFPCPRAKVYSFVDLATIVIHAETLPATEEGYVLKYSDNTRVKIKGDEYCRIHRVISRITPLSIWEMLYQGDNIEFIRKEIPEEFLDDFDQIVDIIETNVYNVTNRVKLICSALTNLSDKEVGLMLNEFDLDVRSLIFPYRKNGLLENRSRKALYRMFRPTSNILEGYRPSSSMNRINDDI